MYIFIKKEDRLMTKSKSKSKFPVIVLFFVLALIGCTFIRYLQYSTVILPETGFFAHDGGFLNSAYYVVVGGFSVIFILTALLDMKAKRGIRSGYRKITLTKEEKKELKKNKDEKSKLFTSSNPQLKRELSSVSSVIGAVLVAATGFFLAIDAIDAVQGVFDASVPFMKAVTMTFAALGYTFVAYVILTHRKIVPSTAIAFLFIASCYVSAAALEFMERTYIANLSARLIVLSVNLMLAVFFLNSGRITVHSENRVSALYTTLFGYLAAVLILSDSVARMVYYYTVSDEVQAVLTFPNNDNGFEVPDILFMLQALAVLWLIYAFSSKKKSKFEELQQSQNKEDENNENDVIEMFTDDGNTDAPV
jgi:hypothetical protein